jgi:probable phosphoglycerate mutase
MTAFYLIRHAIHSFDSNALAGRLPSVHLSAEGQEQAAALAARLANVPMKAIYCSPLERTQETARAIADVLKLEPQIAPEILELDFGEWMGQRFDDLRPQEKWQYFNSFRSGTRAPGGELMLETQSRIVGFMQQLHEKHPDEAVALVSHADVIKSAVAYYMGVPLDLFHRIEISPASISIVTVADYGPQVLCINHTGELASD